MFFVIQYINVLFFVGLQGEPGSVVTSGGGFPGRKGEPGIPGIPVRNWKIE